MDPTMYSSSKVRHVSGTEIKIISCTDYGLFIYTDKCVNHLCNCVYRCFRNIPDCINI